MGLFFRNRNRLEIHPHAERWIDFLETVVIVMMASVFLLFFSSATTPLFQYTAGSDSSFFILVAKGMKQGLLPYRDFFDMKGPYLFWIEYAGQLIFEGKTGAFIIQTFFMIASLLLIREIIYGLLSSWYEEEKAKRKSFISIRLRMCGISYLCMLPYLALLGLTLDRGNLSEEFSLPILLLNLRLTIDYLFQKRSAGNSSEYWEHKPSWAFGYGASAGVLFFIRGSNAALIAANVLTISCILIRYGLWENLWKNIAWFIGGMILSFIPAMIWAAYCGILQKMIYQMFSFGATYAVETSWLDRIQLCFRKRWFLWLYLFLPMAVSVLGGLFSFVERKKNVEASQNEQDQESSIWFWPFLCWSLFIVIFCSIGLWLGNNYIHYYQLITPAIIAAEGIILYLMVQLNDKLIRGCFAVFCLILFIGFFSLKDWTIVNSNVNMFTKNLQIVLNKTEDDLDYQDSVDISDFLLEKEETEPGELFVLGLPSNSRWYFWTDRFPQTRYCDWVEHYSLLSEEYRLEVEKILIDEETRYLLTVKEYVCQVESIQNLVKEYYVSIYSNERYELFIKKAK